MAAGARSEPLPQFNVHQTCQNPLLLAFVQLALLMVASHALESLCSPANGEGLPAWALESSARLGPPAAAQGPNEEVLTSTNTYLHV